MSESPVESGYALARKAQTDWADGSLAERLHWVKRFRHHLAENGGEAARELSTVFRDNPGEALASEVNPLAEACRFLEKQAPSILRRRYRNARFWPFGVRLIEEREPYGVILIIAPSNYPLFLPGVQALQALAAGNAVIIKPGRGGTAAAELLAEMASSSGLPSGLIQVLPESIEAAQEAIACRPDKVVMTGSAESGRAVLRQLADRLIPAAVELSGCDAVFVREDADVDRVIDVICFGLTWNRSATCIAPRRVFVAERLAESLRNRLTAAVDGIKAMRLLEESRKSLEKAAARLESDGAERLAGGIDAGGRVRPFLIDCGKGVAPDLGDVFAPIVTLTTVGSDDEALSLDALCPYALGAVVFGEESGARKLARRIDAGCVTLNDAIAPTADPRLSFGGRHSSGFGVTRGPLGLLEMTLPKLIAIRKGNFLPHLEPMTADTTMLLESGLTLKQGAGFRRRLKALRNLFSALKRIRREEKAEK